MVKKLYCSCVNPQPRSGYCQECFLSMQFIRYEAMDEAMKQAEVRTATTDKMLAAAEAPNAGATDADA
jgi:hypothetical protein